VAQGYHLCRPHAAPVVTEWLRERQRAGSSTASAGVRGG
jgi:hypothetical protein